MDAEHVEMETETVDTFIGLTDGQHLRRALFAIDTATGHLHMMENRFLPYRDLLIAIQEALGDVEPPTDG
jgi:hypothetical protein